jgi:hypothetical protein
MADRGSANFAASTQARPLPSCHVQINAELNCRLRIRLIDLTAFLSALGRSCGDPALTLAGILTLTGIRGRGACTLTLARVAADALYVRRLVGTVLGEEWLTGKHQTGDSRQNRTGYFNFVHKPLAKMDTPWCPVFFSAAAIYVRPNAHDSS